MTELEKLQRAKMYIDKMANGINPIDDTPVVDTDIINNVRLSRCLFYVSDILKQVIDNDGVIGRAKTSKKAFCVSDEDICKFSFSSVPIPVSEIAKRLNAIANLDTCRKISYKAIRSWLLEIGALETRRDSYGKNVSRPTEQGTELGISVERRTSRNGEYDVVVYNRNAQQFILDNIEAIAFLASVEEKSRNTYENHGQPWTPEHDKCVVDLFNKNMTVSEIAATLKRTEGGICARLKKLGLIENRTDAR